MIKFDTPQFQIIVRPEKIAFLSKAPFEKDYTVALMDGVGLPCTGGLTYDAMMATLEDSGFHVRFKTPTGLDTMVNRDFLFLTSPDLAQVTIAFTGARCVVDGTVESVMEAFECG